MAKDPRSYRDRAEYFIEAVSRRRRKLKKMAVELKGGNCELCGYSKYIGALGFHHINSEDKEFGLSADGLTRKWESVKLEIKKCILVCSNCHREIHAGLHKIQHKAGK